MILGGANELELNELNWRDDDIGAEWRQAPEGLGPSACPFGPNGLLQLLLMHVVR